MCFSTARSLMNNVVAMVALLRPVAISLEDLALPLGQGRQRPVARGLAGDQRLHHLGVEHRASAAHLAQGSHQLVDVADPLLEEVAQAGHAVDQQREGVVLLDVLGQHHDPDAGRAPPGCAWPPRCLRSCASAASGCRSARRPARSPPPIAIREAVSARHRHHLDVLDLGQERGQALTDQEVVIGDDEAECHSCDSTHDLTVSEVVLTRTTRGASPLCRAASPSSRRAATS